MQKKNIYLLIIILTVLIAVTTILCYYVNKPEKVTLSQEQLGQIIAKKDLAACDKISTEEQAAICRNNVAATLAKEKLDASFCGMLDGEENQNTCVKEVLNDKAEKEGVAVCQQAATEQEKRDCEKEYYFTMAIQKNDASQCDGLVNEADINECKEGFSEWQEAGWEIN